MPEERMELENGLFVSGMALTHYRKMSTPTKVWAGDIRLGLGPMHNSRIAPHALAIGLHGPNASNRIRCQRIPRPEKFAVSKALRSLRWMHLPVRRQHLNFAIPNAAHWCRALGTLAAPEQGRQPDCSTWILSMSYRPTTSFPSPPSLSPLAEYAAEK